MDLKTRVFNAVSYENLHMLKELLQPLTKEEIKEVVSVKTDGTTPLLIAARYGYYHIMQFLIKSCYVDIEQVGRVEFVGEIVDDAPPLWCAAAAGSFPCVKLLLRHGANVNCTTRTTSTPLRAACFDGHLEIVKLLVEHGADIEIANEHGHTCLMISCYKGHYNIASYLIDQGCQINRESIKGNTALHDCAESNSNMDIMKLLIRNGAVFKRDCFGLTPLMTAAISGNVEMFNYLKSVFICSTKDEVDAYKLLGATYVDKFINLTEAFQYWQIALKLSSKCSTEYMESLNNTDEAFLQAYAKTQEFKTEEELNNLYCDPDLMKMQSLIIRERILGINHPETYCFIRYRGTAYADSGDYNRCLALWLYNLERQQSVCKPLSDIVQNSFLSMIELFTFMFSKCDSGIRYCDIFRVLKAAINDTLSSCNFSTTSKKHAKLLKLPDRKVAAKDDPYSMFKSNINGLDRQFRIVIHLIGFICQLRPKLSTAVWNDFKKSIYDFVSYEPRSTCSYSILHILCIMCNEKLIASIELSLFEIFSLLVDVSSNVNSVDIYGNTPLHILLHQGKVNKKMVSYLIQAGAHIDLCNEEGLTPLDHLNGSPLGNYYKAKYLSLQCLCAHYIAKNRIPFDTLPSVLENFVTNHQNKSQSSKVYYC